MRKSSTASTVPPSPSIEEREYWVWKKPPTETFAARAVIWSWARAEAERRGGAESRECGVS
jgi:hypothetical protein